MATKQVDPAMEARKVEALAQKLMAEHTLGELGAMHHKAFGIAIKGKDKARLAEKLARHVIHGDSGGDNGKGNGQTEPAQAATDLDSPDDPQGTEALTPEQELSACAALARIKGAWDDWEKLSEEKKTKMAELRQTIAVARDAIGEVFINEKMTDGQKLARVEGHWRTMQRIEAKKTELAKEFSEKMKDTKQSLKHEMDNVRQLRLKFEG